MLRTIPGFLLGFVLAALLAAGALFWILRSDGVRIDTSRPTVVHHIRQLQRLETVVYGMDKIVSGGQESRYLPKLLSGDRLLLIVYGEVTAGVDLAGLENGQVRIDGRAIDITMPPAEIFATRLDNDRTRVYARETGLFTRADPNLESDVRREAEHQVRQAALDAGILPTATANARTTLTSFLKGLGFEAVVVR
jgi:alkylation response protein AidB-like acyl-CoA dehydrogenase